MFPPLQFLNVLLESQIEKELEAVTKLKVIKQQLYVASEWKRLYDERMVCSKFRTVKWQRRVAGNFICEAKVQSFVCVWVFCRLSM